MMSSCQKIPLYSFLKGRGKNGWAHGVSSLKRRERAGKTPEEQGEIRKIDERVHKIAVAMGKRT